MKKKKIFEVVSQLASGGAERFLIDLCNELTKQYEVTLIVLFPLEEYDFFIEDLDNKIKVISFNKQLGYDLTLPVRILKFINKEKPSIVHTHLNSFFYVILTMLVRNRSVSFYHTIHNDALAEAPGKFSLSLKKLLFKFNFSTPVTISAQTQKSFIENYGFNSININNGRYINYSKIVTDCNLVKQFKTSEDTVVLLSIGRISPQKNQIMLARSVIELIQTGFDVVLLIIGKTHDKEIKNSIKKLNCDKIHFLGELSNPLDYLICADAFCLTSLHEGMPITMIEAFALGVIPICTPAGGISDMINNGVNGFLSKDFSKEEYLLILKQFLKLKDVQKNNIKRNSRNSYRSYSMENCSREYMKLFYLKPL